MTVLVDPLADAREVKDVAARGRANRQRVPLGLFVRVLGRRRGLVAALGAEEVVKADTAAGESVHHVSLGLSTATTPNHRQFKLHFFGYHPLT